MIALPHVLRQILETQWQDHTTHYPVCLFVFHRSGQKIKDFRGAWERACREAGLSAKILHNFRRITTEFSMGGCS